MRFGRAHQLSACKDEPNVLPRYHRKKRLHGRGKSMEIPLMKVGHDYPDFLGWVGRWRSFISFEKARLGVPGVLLRHDVDISLVLSHQMALVENSLGVRSTYFVMVNSDFYNPAETSQIRLLRELVELGHEIGLHFDQSAYGFSNDLDLDRAIGAEAKWLEHLVGSEVTAVSFHNPSLIGSTPELEVYSGLTNAYSRSIMEVYDYWTDSAGRWNKKHGLPSDQGPTHVQLLIHPEWWFGREKSNLRRVAEAVIGRANSTLLGHIDRVFKSTGTYGDLHSTQIRDDSGREEDQVSLLHNVLRRIQH